MDSITLENYRCFGEQQTARLAPLTLLVGENSTGKTSFLALVRALWDMAYLNRVPNFRETPFDLGSFREIAHHRGRGGSSAKSFRASFTGGPLASSPGYRTHEGVFVERDAAPYPIERSLSSASTEVRLFPERRIASLRRGTEVRETPFNIFSHDRKNLLSEWEFVLLVLEDYGRTSEGKDKFIKDIVSSLQEPFTPEGARPFAIAPVRSKPQRTYDPTLQEYDAEGDYVPSYFASLAFHKDPDWDYLKSRIEEYGAAAGLFNRIQVKFFDKTSVGPFQIQVQRHSPTHVGPWRNIIDVGYGVSQALPILTEIFRTGPPRVLLLQQPEVHLHPKAQAALGTLFCKVVSADQHKQFIIETHSGYLIDRVRMEIRDGNSGLRPEDVSIVFFERNSLEVKIHNVRFDELGNVLDAPLSYGQFFMDEMNRSVGF